jgi:steroid 5-alpha reductase family enzyme
VVRPDARADRLFSSLALLLAYLLGGAAAIAVASLARARFPDLHPVLVAGLADLAATVVVFAFSVAFDNSSVYDPYWSVAPVAIALAWLIGGMAGSAGAGAPPPGGAAANGLLGLPGVGPRQAAVLLLVLAWSVRLTGNCLARWRGLAHEDWRYAERRRLGAGYWPVSFLGFHLMPTVLVFLGCLSLWPVLAGAGGPVGVVDWLALVLTLGAIVLEAVADLQLQRFIGRGDPEHGVVAEGLWSVVRHPNYLGEVLFWWGLWVFALAADPAWWWAAAGPAAITLMFVFISVPMMDRHLLERRPAYAQRLRSVPALLPWPRPRG